MYACAYFVIILCLAVNTDTKLVKRSEGDINGGERNLLETGAVEETISDGNASAANADTSAPIGLFITSVRNTSISLKWGKPRTSMGHILRYRISLKSSTSDDERETENDNTFFIVDRLTPRTSYILKVRAITTSGPGEWSYELSATTRVGVPGAPKELRATWIRNTTVSLKWEKPLTFGGYIQRYRVHWKSFSSHGENDTSNDNTSFTVGRLSPYVNYTFKVLALTEAGPGEWSEELEVLTDVGVPHAPVGLIVTTISNKTMGLKWVESNISTGPILEYRIQWKNSSSEGEIYTESSNTSFTVDKLIPDVIYFFRVLAVTKAGPGNWSESVHAQTKGILGDVCAWNPCKNGGTCTLEKGIVKCFCTESFRGKFCDSEPEINKYPYAVIFAVVGAILLIILLSVGIAVCVRSQNSKMV